MKDNIANGNFELRLLRGAQLDGLDRLRNGSHILRPVGRDHGLDQIPNLFIDLIAVDPLHQQREHLIAHVI